MSRLILATRNNHKIKEIKSILNDLNIDILTLTDIDSNIVLREDGTSFEENALQKARAVYNATGILSMADDSGIEVFYLNNRPGVFSSRYSGENATDEMNNKKLLSELLGVPPRRRRAQYRCVVALVGKNIEKLTEGKCTGRITEQPRGRNGFGYDPIFIPDGYEKTFGELDPAEKNRISHRAQAILKMRKFVIENINILM